MTKIYDNNKLDYFIKKCNINNFFESNVKEFMELHFFKKGEHICEKGERLNYFYFFVEGRAKVYISTPNGKSLLIRFCSPLQIIGDIEMISDVVIDCSIQAITNCLCIAIPINVFKNILCKDIIFLNFVCKELSYKLSSASAATSINVLYPLENRLASYLLALYPNDMSPKDDIIKDNFTQIAELLGSDYRHFLRVVDKLCSKNIIKKEKRALTILDRNALKELAVNLYY